MLSAGGGCEITVSTRVKTAWKKFRELLPVLTFHHLSYKTCILECRAMLHASETWPLTKTNLQHLQCNDRMIRQICSIKQKDVATVRSMELLAKLELSALDKILGQLGIYATWLSLIAYLQKQLRIFIFFMTQPLFFCDLKISYCMKPSGKCLHIYSLPSSAFLKYQTSGLYCT